MKTFKAVEILLETVLKHYKMQQVEDTKTNAICIVLSYRNIDVYKLSACEF